MRADIEHPYILDAQTNRVVATKQAQRGGRYLCLCCNPSEDMVIKQGHKVQKHAAHHPQSGYTEGGRGGESDLHWAAVQMIKHAFQTCLSRKKPFTLWAKCPFGHVLFRKDLIKAGYDQCRAEDTRCLPHVRPDLTFKAPDRLFFLEVVYTHDIEGTTRQRYQAFGRPVLVWRVFGTDDLKQLNTGSDPWLLVEPAVHVAVDCTGCRRKQERNQQHQQKVSQERQRQRTAQEQAWWSKAAEITERRFEGEVLNDTDDYMERILARREVAAQDG